MAFRDDEEMILSEIPGILGYIAGPFADRIAFGYLFRRLRPLKVEDVVTRIEGDLPLFEMDNDPDWPRWSEAIKKFRLDRHITVERLSSEFQKRRPDIFEAATCCPNGPEWFRRQISELRVNLGLDQPVKVWKIIPPPPENQ